MDTVRTAVFLRTMLFLSLLLVGKGEVVAMKKVVVYKMVNVGRGHSRLKEEVLFIKGKSPYVKKIRRA